MRGSTQGGDGDVRIGAAGRAALGVLLVGRLWAGTAELAAQVAPPREARAEVPGAGLWYTDSGGPGQVVVLVHAATGSSRVWEHQLPIFAARGYRVVTYDRRGFGRSEILPSGPQPGTGADDLKALLDHLRLDRVHLVGTAAGGIVSLDFAVSFPDRLRSLVVANSVGGVQDESYLEIGRRLRPAPQFGALPPDVRELGPSYRASNPEGTDRWLALERVSRPGTAAPVAQAFRNRLTFSLLERIAVPTLLLTGDADLYSPPAVLPLFAARIRGAQSVVIAGAGHSAYWEQPELFNRTVLDFLSTH
jgi:pimeloyl-ACP methyl ester carboxylesterase